MDKDKEKGKRYCFRLISLRPRSIYEIKERLREKGYSDEMIDDIRKGLEEKNLLNDVKFTEEWIELRLRTTPRATRVIKIELEQKGVSEDIIDKVFIKKSDDLNDEKIAKGLIQNKLSSLNKESTRDKKIKLFRLLLSKGFDREIAEEVIERFLLVQE